MPLALNSHARGGAKPPPVARHLERVSREGITLNRAVWASYAALLAVLACGSAGIGLMVDAYPQRSVLVYSMAVALAALVAVGSAPPALGTVRNHLAVISPYLLISVGMLAYGPGALIPVAAAMHVGPFIAARLYSRLQIGLHLIAASAALVAPVAFGFVDGSAAIGVAIMLPAMWILCVCVVVVLEAAEAQGGELEMLTRRDPLTGVGNRRLLDERLDQELARHRRTHHPLSVIALDLNGFKALNDTVGHDAGDRLLCEVAAVLQTTIRAQDTVVRQGGDEFCLLLPETSPPQARTVALAVREALANLIHDGPPVTTGIGIATFPADADNGDELLNVADQRLRVDKADSDRPRTARWRAAPAPVPPPPVVTERAHRLTQVDRVELGNDPAIWLVTSVMFSISTAVTILCTVLLDENVLLGLALSAAIVLCTAATWILAPPRIGTVANHALIVSVPIFVAVFVAAFPAAAGAALGAATFMGPLPAMRLVDRRQIAAHFAFASLILAALVPLGAVDQTTALMLLVVAAGVWGLGIACVAVLETAESESRELEGLVRRDPLTGAGNRRMLSERLDYEIRRHARTHRPLSVLSLDINGFKAINDDLGHAAGDELLRDVATALQATVRDQDAVIRQGGDEFCVLLPETGADAAATVAASIGAGLATINAHGHAVSCGIGVATLPTDATSADALLQVADDRLRAEKAGTRSEHFAV